MPYMDPMGLDSGFVSIEFFTYFFYIMTSQLCTTTLGKSFLHFFYYISIVPRILSLKSKFTPDTP